MSDKGNCLCSKAPFLVFSCSGGSDVGEISDRTARALGKAGKGRMYCLAGVGGHIEGITANTKAASGILAIDGCPVDCAKHILEHAGFTAFQHLRITDLGYTKGSSPVTDERVADVAGKAEALIS